MYLAQNDLSISIVEWMNDDSGHPVEEGGRAVLPGTQGSGSPLISATPIHFSCHWNPKVLCLQAVRFLLISPSRVDLSIKAKIISKGAGVRTRPLNTACLNIAHCLSAPPWEWSIWSIQTWIVLTKFPQKPPRIFPYTNAFKTIITESEIAPFPLLLTAKVTWNNSGKYQSP